jgi:hypothetical protein
MDTRRRRAESPEAAGVARQRGSRALGTPYHWGMSSAIRLRDFSLSADEGHSATDARRAALEVVLGPIVHGTAPGLTGGPMTHIQVAKTAAAAAKRICPVLGDPPRSLHRIRGLLVPALICPWSEIEAMYATVLDGLLALPPAREDVEDPAWDAHVPRAARASLVDREIDYAWTPPKSGVLTTGPAGTPGRIAKRDVFSTLLTTDGRTLRMRARCECSHATRQEKGVVCFEDVAFRKNGTVLDVTLGEACNACRAIISTSATAR